MISLDCGLAFDPVRDEEFFAALPPRPAVFLVEPKQSEAQPYLARTADLRRRLERLLHAPSEPSKRLNLREFAAGVRFRMTGSAFEQALAFYQHARRLFPQRYRDFLRLRPPALLKLNLASAYPRCYVTRRIFGDTALYYGPFPSRKAAETFADEFLNLFKIRRCQIKIRRDPAFPGCIYSEMKMCLAPCFAGCTKPEYDVEVTRVADFLASAGASLAGEIEREREAASEALDYERAAALHKRVEKVEGVLRGLPELARRITQLDAVILQPAAEEGSIAVFPAREGKIADPFFLRFGELASQPRSVEQILRENLEPQTSADAAADQPARAASHDLSEHLSLLARWFYSKPRTGEIFFRETGPRARAGRAWPYRRILRACSRLLSSTASAPET